MELMVGHQVKLRARLYNIEDNKPCCLSIGYRRISKIIRVEAVSMTKSRYSIFYANVTPSRDTDCNILISGVLVIWNALRFVKNTNFFDMMRSIFEYFPRMSVNFMFLQFMIIVCVCVFCSNVLLRKCREGMW